MARKKQITQAVIGYCRVSTEDQAGNGVSLDAQRHRVSPWPLVPWPCSVGPTRTVNAKARAS